MYLRLELDNKKVPLLLVRDTSASYSWRDCTFGPAIKFFLSFNTSAFAPGFLHHSIWRSYSWETSPCPISSCLLGSLISTLLQGERHVCVLSVSCPCLVCIIYSVPAARFYVGGRMQEYSSWLVSGGVVSWDHLGTKSNIHLVFGNLDSVKLS